MLTIMLYYITLHYITLHHIKLHQITLNYITLYFNGISTLQDNISHYTIDIIFIILLVLTIPPAKHRLSSSLALKGWKQQSSLAGAPWHSGFVC